MPEKKRDAIAQAIRQTAAVSIGHASVEEIDRFGILKACHLAMVRAWMSLAAPRDALIIVDGDLAPAGIAGEVTPVIGADASCPSVAAASIIAKVDRDRTMRDLAGDDDRYHWRRNKGYGVPAHMAALEEHGITIHHRRSFAPVARAIAKGRGK